MKCSFGISNFLKEISQFSSVQFSSLTQSCLTLRPHELQHAQSSLKLMSIESMMSSSHLILCRPLLLLYSIPPSIRVFPMSQLFSWGGQSTGVSVSASVLPMNTQDWSPLGWTGWISLKSKRLLRVFSTPQFKSISSLALSFLHSPTLTSIHDHWKNHILD